MRLGTKKENDTAPEEAPTESTSGAGVKRSGTYPLDELVDNKP